MNQTIAQQYLSHLSIQGFNTEKLNGCITELNLLLNAKRSADKKEAMEKTTFLQGTLLGINYNNFENWLGEFMELGSEFKVARCGKDSYRALMAASSSLAQLKLAVQPRRIAEIGMTTGTVFTIYGPLDIALSRQEEAEAITVFDIRDECKEIAWADCAHRLNY